ncbi:MAG: 2-oxo-4-hydroxy-4-carboxy-5-ureidoimidazoline decarboxylase [Pseudomonadota bacterium]
MSEPLETLNTATHDAALTLLEPLVERSAWVAEKAVSHRPFASDEDIAQNLVNALLEAKFEMRVSVFRAHPELAGKEATEGTMTKASTVEQDRLGLLSLSASDAHRLRRLNAEYAARFGHPYIVALHRVSDLAQLFETFERRLNASAVEEHVSTLAEIASVIYARANAAFGPQADPLLRIDCGQHSPTEADGV